MRFVVQQTLTVIVDAEDEAAAVAEVGETWTYPWSTAETVAYPLDEMLVRPAAIHISQEPEER